MADRRLQSRLLCADLVRVSWTADDGSRLGCTVLLEDIAPGGACLQFEEPMPAGLRLRIEHPCGRLDGVIRYCVFREIGWFAGVAFDSATQWSQDEYEPEHLLDIEDTVEEAARRAIATRKLD